MTKVLIPDLELVVPFDEKEKYEEHNQDVNVLVTPEEVNGITATKQWMLKNIGTWFSVDDDIWCVKKMYEDNAAESSVNDPDMIRDIIQRCCYMAEEKGAYMFGFTKERNPLMYVSHNPFKFSGYMNSSHFGVIAGSKLWYNLEMNEGEDHWLSCLNAFEHRFFLMDTRYSFYTKDNFVAEGGCNSYRTLDSMKKNTLLLRKTFGSVVNIKTSSKLRQNVNYGERSLSIPL